MPPENDITPGPTYADPSGLEGAKPLSLAVVIPSYNRSEYLREAIDSVLEQDHPDLTLLVVDGGSTDGSIDILKSYGDRVDWVSEPDEGHADAINKGWARTRSEVIAWLNADDRYAGPDATRLGCQYLAASPETDIVYGDCRWIDERGRDCGLSYVQPFSLEFAVLTADHCIPQPAAFVRRSLVERAGVLRTDVFTKDREFWLRAALHGRIDYWPRTLAEQRNDQGISFQGRTVAHAIYQVSEEFFRTPDLPGHLRQLKPRAMSNAALRAAYYAWMGGQQWDLYAWYVLRAFLNDTSNLRRIQWHLRRYVGESLGWPKPAQPIPA